MENEGIITTAVLAVILKLSSLSLAQIVITPDSLSTQSNHIEVFNALLRDVDLNTETQNSYAITKREYEQLKTAWKRLPPPNQYELLYSDLWTGTCIKALLYDLNDDEDWETFIVRLPDNWGGYDTRGLSLTLSQFNHPVSLNTARKTLVDLLCTGSSMVKDGKLKIDEEIKTQATERAGGEARPRLEKWQQLINESQKRSDMDKLKAVNEFFNRHIMARTDKGTEKGYDYWQSPIETLVRGIGDCDDFAMAKYVSLRLLGIQPEPLRVAVVEYPLIGGHAVLLFFPPNEKDPWVLDNLIFKYNGLIDSHILRLSERMIRHKIKPLWGINENCLTEFRGGLNEKVTSTDPRHSSSKFGTALMNSQRVLPQGSGRN